MEEVPDEGHNINRLTLPEGVPALLMTNKEFDTLQEGERLAIKAQDSQSHTRRQEKPREPEVQECQPTSSRVKVEDLVTDEQEKAYEDHKDIQMSHSAHSFWDQPIPWPQYDWPYDP